MKSPSRLLCIIVLASLLPLHAEISAEKITALEKALTTSKTESSAARQRLTVKRAVRDAEELLKANASAANRFVLLDVLFRARQELVKLDNEADNRLALLETAKQLAAAPDEFALQRFDADLLLSQSESARKGADENARAMALLTLADRYRGTQAEAKSLKVAIVIAMELGDTQIAETLRSRIEERFAADLEMIEFQRQHFGGQVIGAPLSGTFELADGKHLRFPMDGMGKSTMLLFWSNNEIGKKHLAGFAAANKALSAQTTGRLQIISCNIDNLPDAGQSILKDMGIDWPALKIPGGKENPYYKAFTQNSSAVITLSPTGVAALVLQGSTRNNSGRNVETTGDLDYERWIGSSLSRGWTQPRYMSQLCYLHSGEFLLHDQTSTTLPQETLAAIQQCFLPPILRFEAPNAELIALFQKADDLCAKAVASTPSAPDLWLLRNHRIAALNALWKLTGERAHLDKALLESQISLAANPPPAASVIPQLTVARDALRQTNAKPGDIITDFLNKLGGENAPATALTAASILALESADRELHEALRTKLLAKHANDPTIAPVVALLLDRHYRYWLHQVPFTAGWSFGRREKYFQTVGQPEDATRPFSAALLSVDGTTVTLPQDYPGKWLLILVPSTVPGEKVSLAKILSTQFAHYKRNLIEKRGGDELQLIVALMDDDASRAKINYVTPDITCPVLLMQGGIRNPLATRLGLLNEPGRANMILVKPDGFIAAVLNTQNEQQSTIPNIIERYDEIAVDEALARGDMELAKTIAFRHAPTEPPASSDPKKKPAKLPPPCLAHLRARAKVYLAMKEYDKALVDAQEVLSQERATAGGMSLRTPALTDSENFVAQVQKFAAPSK